MQLNLCLDTNILLSFYHFSDDTLDKLEKLIILSEAKDIQIILSEQIIHEFRRNREIKIKDTLKKIDEMEPKLLLPHLVQWYEETKLLRDILEQFKNQKDKLLKRVNDDINNYSLKADSLIGAIFNKAKKIPISEKILIDAKNRFDLWNPPWKNASYWDAVVWESLLSFSQANKTKIHFISHDSDYINPLNKKELLPYLSQDRTEKTGTILYFYVDLTSFLQVNFPSIIINEEYLNNKYINHFCTSNSFDNARYYLWKIYDIESFSDEQIFRIVNASISNDQIIGANYYSEWVWEYLVDIVEKYESRIDLEMLLQFYKIYDSNKFQKLEHELDEAYYEYLSEEKSQKEYI